MPAEKYEERKKQVEGVAAPIFSSLYGAGGTAGAAGGGMGGMGDLGGECWRSVTSLDWCCSWRGSLWWAL